MASGQTYAVSVGPGSPYTHCEVGDNASGTIGTEDVEVTVSCKGCGQGGRCFAFTTSEQHARNLGGLAGADAICQRLAEAAELPGTYKAWLSDATSSPATRFVHSPGAYHQVDARWTSSHSDPCNAMWRLYCFQQS